MLPLLGEHCHEDDRIGAGIKEGIAKLFTGTDINSYALNNHIRQTISNVIDIIFNGQSSIPLSDFCDSLANGIEKELITPFTKTSRTNIKALRKAYGKKFRKHKKSPYPFVSKILATIDHYDIPFDVEGNEKKVKLYNRFLNWCKVFKNAISDFDSETSVDFLNNQKLSKLLTGFGNGIDARLTPIVCKTYLSDNLLTSIDEGHSTKASDFAQHMLTQFTALAPKLEDLITNEAYEDNGDPFLGIDPIEYVNRMKKALEPNQFLDYEKVIKNWVKSLDELISELNSNPKNLSYNYKSKIIALGLSKLFNVEHNLIDLKPFITPIINEIKATGYSLELSKLDELFEAGINNSSIYSSLINRYNAAVEAGTFSDDFNTLETSLPSIAKIKYAILKAKIDLILNREMQMLTLQWELIWNNRANVLQNLLAFLSTQANIGATVINTLQGLIGGGGPLLDSTIILDIPIKLGLGRDADGKPFAFGTMDAGTTENDIYSIDNETPYSLDCSGVYHSITSDTSASKTKTVNSVVNLKLEFENPGVDVGIDISAFVLSTGGSAIVNQRTLSLEIPINLSSTFDGKNVTVRLLETPPFDTNEITGAGEELQVIPAYTGIITSTTFKAFN